MTPRHDLQCILTESSSFRKAKDTIHISRSVTDNLDISFQRTIRVADGKGVSELPPSMGTFPLYSIAEYKDKLPAAMGAKGGAFLTMYRKSRCIHQIDASKLKVHRA